MNIFRFGHLPFGMICDLCGTDFCLILFAGYPHAQLNGLTLPPSMDNRKVQLSLERLYLGEQHHLDIHLYETHV